MNLVNLKRMNYCGAPSPRDFISTQGSASARAEAMSEATHYTNSHAGETPTVPRW